MESLLPSDAELVTFDTVGDIRTWTGLSAVNISLGQLTHIRRMASLPQSDSSRDDPGGVDVEGEKVLRSDGHYWLNNPLQWPRLPQRQETRPARK